MKLYKLVLITVFVSMAASCNKTALYEYPTSTSKEAEITGFSLVSEDGADAIFDSKIDSVAKTVTVTAKEGTALNDLFPRASVSEGVIVNPQMGVLTDFTSPVIYTLLAGDRKTTQKWTITVSLP